MSIAGPAGSGQGDNVVFGASDVADRPAGPVRRGRPLPRWPQAWGVPILKVSASRDPPTGGSEGSS
ncbi:hypothetical protein SAMN05216215_101594 [Saccharopolyspora shandongensis]|uniref:Uncharacterized protein n=1 Tax=Saccharopolyspora shandongensis TaxID=418495 RepID=A0A1H3EQ24_9PSEU|nr:hypothetical protein SAMN05216215_101594 [Saccharopolyspora shandongensis]